MAKGEATEAGKDTLSYLNGMVVNLGSEERPSVFYDAFYENEKSYRLLPSQSQYYSVWDKILEKIDLGEPIIDLGCGSGQFVKLARSRGFDFIYGIDFSKVAIDLAREMNPDVKDHFFLLDLYKPRHYPKACIVLSEVLEHISGDLLILKNLDPGTHLVFTLPNYLTPSHVRAMPDEEEIRERYGKLIEIRSIDSVMMDSSHDWKIWVVDGRVQLLSAWEVDRSIIDGRIGRMEGFRMD